MAEADLKATVEALQKQVQILTGTNSPHTYTQRGNTSILKSAI